jgi:acetyl/propionyl-CoA carboxylase alpha subunit
MARALDELTIEGVATNQGFHRRLMADKEFREGEIDIQFLDRRADLANASLSDGVALELAIAAALAEDEARSMRRPSVSHGDTGGGSWLNHARLEALR